MLTFLLKTAQQGQEILRTMITCAQHQEMKDILRSQLRELGAIESEAHALACQRGLDPPENDAALSFLRSRLAKLKLGRSDQDSRIAQMLIRSNTSALVDTHRNLNRYERTDAVSTLYQKHIDCCTAAVRRMEPFL